MLSPILRPKKAICLSHKLCAPHFALISEASPPTEAGQNHHEEPRDYGEDGRGEEYGVPER